MNRNTSHGGLTLALVGAMAVCALPAQAETEPQTEGANREEAQVHA